MSKSLVIVESPAKAKTIGKYLGKDFEVLASVGHIMDLPKNDLGVELKKRTFEPTLIVSPGKEKVVGQLRKAASKADQIFLAPDPDREGEAIAYHLLLQLGTSGNEKKKIHRVTFNEITKKAVQDAFQHARDVDQNLVDAQQTRRVLDRLVGYQISPLLWDKVRRGLSAGRVQTVAVRLIVEREREIGAFKPVEYWTLDAFLHPEKQANGSFKARFVGINGEPARVANGKDKDGRDQFIANALPDKKQMDEVVAALGDAKWSVVSVESQQKQRRPLAPFITSQLQRDAASKLGYNVRRTMGVAQRLYEGVEIGSEGPVGLITYMRTDSPRVAPEAKLSAREWIAKNLGPQYLPATPNEYRGKKDAQDAHEAIRPTDASRTPESLAKFLTDEQLKLYRLIWQRFVASQMTPAQFDVTTAKIAAVSQKNSKTYDFRVSGSVLRFDGFLKVYEAFEDKNNDDEDEAKNKLPNLDGVKALALEKLEPEDHFTSPPPRYNEASLVKVLEERGIGRPSTYASIISTIQDREYVTKIAGRFYPTEIGMVVCDLLVESFPYIFDTQYTARLEEELDDIEDGKEKWTTLLNGFYDHFEDELNHADKKMRNIKRMEQMTDEKCDLCGSPLLLKWGKFGSFYACSAYNKKDPTSCTFTKENTANKPDLNTPEAEGAAEQDEYCENCGKVMVLRRGPFGMFMACPDYNADPPCRTFRKLTSKQQQKQSAPQPTGEDCPQCGKPLVLRQGAYGEFVSCSGYPKCKYVKQNIIEGMKCPKCGTGDIAERKAKRGNIFWGCTNYPKCDFTSNYKPVPEKCPECGSAYLLEKTLKSGIYLECPNKKASKEEAPAPKKKGKKAAAEVEQGTGTCHFSKRIGDAPPPPTAETHGPVVDGAEKKHELLPA
ncbi:type I DNA topoisomerase [Occallatibacter riparius]|uniref:DNA topoisomerase 1 n=1 Tax=Occallatibacter riparius TaxID=1002689 RepID=A0A9J7BJY4_9BACT|nr:type I DNA topoisomerase [Occallatibacter riparius]UWZ82975.1 type I DNA topoisomerase [Occallatibacter riparius]